MSSQWSAWELLFAILLSNLGAEDYGRRQAAHRVLQQVAPLAVHRLQIAEKSSDREVATRARQLLNRYYADSAATWARHLTAERDDEFPWIADIPSEHTSGALPYYLDIARGQLEKQGPPNWPEYRLATRLLVQDLYTRRVSQRDILLLLSELAESERQWIDKNGSRTVRTIHIANDR
jgi:hypothetical protein